MTRQRNTQMTTTIRNSEHTKPDAAPPESPKPRRSSKYPTPRGLIHAAVYSAFSLGVRTVEGAMGGSTVAPAQPLPTNRMLLTTNSACARDRRNAATAIHNGKVAAAHAHKITAEKHCLTPAQKREAQQFETAFQKAEKQLTAAKHAGEHCRPHVTGTLPTLRIPPGCKPVPKPIASKHPTHPTPRPVAKVPTPVPVESAPVPVPVVPSPVPVPVPVAPVPVPVVPSPVPVPVVPDPVPVPVIPDPSPVPSAPVVVSPVPTPVGPTPAGSSCADGALFEPGPSLAVSTDTGGPFRSFAVFNPTNTGETIAILDNSQLSLVPFSPGSGFGDITTYPDVLGSIMGGGGKLDGSPYESLVFSQFVSTDVSSTSTINILRGGANGLTLQLIHTVEDAAFNAVRFGPIKPGMVDSVFAVGNGSTDDQVKVLLNDGTGTLTLGQVLVVPTIGTLDVAVADMNLDGINDLVTLGAQVVNNVYGFAVGVSLGNGDGTFNAGTIAPTATSSLSAGQVLTLTIANVGGSMGPDVFVSVGQDGYDSPPFLQQLQNLGGGNLAAGQRIFVGSGGGAAVSADFLSTGHVAIVTAGYFAGSNGGLVQNFDFHLSQGNGQFYPPSSIASLPQVIGFMSLANLQGKGRTDLAMADDSGNVRTFTLCA